LAKDIAPEYPADLVIRVNEVFNDVERDGYDVKHAQTLRDEAVRWRALGKALLGGERDAVSVLDVGCGTGFVARQLAPFLYEGDRLVCSDVSAGMLETCEKLLREQGLDCRAEFRKSSGGALDLEDESFDLVVMNSVLHHVPEPGAFLADMHRLLRPGGRLVICHEPSRPFYASRLMRWNHRLVFYLFQPKEAVIRVLRALRVHDPVKRLYRRVLRKSEAPTPVLDEVNRRLLEEGTVERGFTPDELISITDVHSPISGGWHPQRGIDIRRLAEDRLPGLVIERLETYNHLGELVPRFFLSRWYEALVARVRSSRGATFMAVLRKRDRP